MQLWGLVFTRKSRNKIRMRSNLPLISALKWTWHENLYYLIGKSFQNIEEWLLLYFNSIIGCWVIQDFDLCKLQDLWHHNGDPKWCNNKIWNIWIWGIWKVLRVEILQGWFAARTTHCDRGNDVTIDTYLLRDLYLPQFNRLSCACSVLLAELRARPRRTCAEHHC